MSSPTGGYLTYIGREGCPGCNLFKQKILPSLRDSLPGNVVFVEVIQPSSNSMSTPLSGYSNLSKSRPAIEFPMLAWSMEEPSSSSARFDFLTAENMGRSSKIIEWLKQRIPVEQVQATPSYSQSSVFGYGTPSYGNQDALVTQSPTYNYGSYQSNPAPSNGSSMFFNRYY